MIEKLTGNIRYRRGWFGRLVLQIEVSQPFGEYDGVGFYSTVNRILWRDAKVEDLLTLKVGKNVV